MAMPQAPAPPSPVARASQVPDPGPGAGAPPGVAPVLPLRPTFTPALRPSFTPAPARQQARRVTGTCVAGAHGGSGATTVASLIREVLNDSDETAPVVELPPCPDGDPRQIAADSGLAGHAQERVLIVTARSTADGTRRAVIAVTVTGLLGLHPPVLAVISDGAGPLPPAGAQRLAQLAAEKRVSAIVEIPFSPAIRAGTAGGKPDKRLQRAVLKLAEAVRDSRGGGRS